MVHVFHHNDNDGFGSAALVRQALPSCEIRFVCCDYSFPINRDMDMIQPTDTIYIVDYSFKSDNVRELLDLLFRVGHERLFWIDHHKSSFDLVQENPALQKIKGLIDLRFSGIALTWMFLHQLPCSEESFLSLPRAVQLVSDYDTWTKSMPESELFHTGLSIEDTQVDSAIWDQVITDDNKVSELIAAGTVIKSYLERYYARKLKRYGFITTFAGYECLAINQKDNAEIFGEERAKYPLCVIFQTDGHMWYYTVYSSDPAIDCSRIAALHGGGGHQGAAGFRTKELLNEFKR